MKKTTSTGNRGLNVIAARPHLVKYLTEFSLDLFPQFSFQPDHDDGTTKIGIRVLYITQETIDASYQARQQNSHASTMRITIRDAEAEEHQST